MTQVSEIIVNWTPPESGRVQSVQIQSRIVGTEQWQERASNFEEEAGTYIFQSNAPASDIEVRMRNRMSNGIYGDWSTATIRSAGEAIFYDKLTGLPTSLGQISPNEGTKLEGIAPKADVTGDNTSKDTMAVGGTPAATVIKNIVDVQKGVADAIKDTADINARITTFNTQVDADKIVINRTIDDGLVAARREAADALRAESTDIRQQITTITAGNENAGAEISRIETAYKAADKSLADQITTIQANSVSVADVDAKITEAKTVLARADAAIIDTATKATAEYKELDRLSNVRINDQVQALADTNTAFARRSNTLEATISNVSTSIAKNDNFNSFPDFQTHPSHWQMWAAGGNYRTNRLAPGRGGGQYCVQTLNDVAEVDSGFYQQVNTAGAGKWVVEVTVNGDGSGLRGAGVTLHGVWSIDFLSDPDTNGRVGDSQGEIRSWSKMFDIDSRDVINLHAMHGWSGFGRGMAAKYMVWHRLAIRPATDGEIKAQKADSTLNTPGTGLVAKISAVESVITNLPANYASASRATAIEARVGNDGGNLLVNGTFSRPSPTWVYDPGNISNYPLGWTGWAQDGSGYIGPITSRRSNYGALYPLQIDRNGANNGITQNLGTQAAGWYVIEADVTFEDGNHYGSGVHINFNNGYGGNFGFGTLPDTNGGILGGVANVNRKFSFLLYNGAVGENVSFYLMAGWTGFGSPNGFLRTIWHRACVRPATDGEIKAQKADTALNQAGGLVAKITNLETVTTNGTFAAASRATALEAQINGEAGSRLLSRAESIAVSQADRAIGTSNSRMDVMVSEYNGIGSKVTQQAGTIADVNYRTRAYIVSTAVAGNNRAQLAIYADSNNGAGVDIVGDVSISGNLLVGGSITSGKLGPSSVQQVAFYTLGYDMVIPRGGYGGGGYGGGGGGSGGGGYNNSGTNIP